MARTKDKPLPVPQTPIDFVIVTALDEERDSMLSKLRGYKRLDKEANDIYTYYYALVKSRRKDKSVYQVIVACPLNMGPLNAAILASALVQKWKPQYVLLVGIACGIKGEVNYGDVLVATQVADYTLGKLSEGKRKVRWEVSPSGPSLLDSANNLSANWVEQIRTERPTRGNPSKVKGVIASGGDVISDDEIIKAYSESWPKLIGIEMESAGISAGLHQTADRPEFLMIKSVSDFGKDKHNDEVIPWRNYACHTSATFALELIKSGPSKSSILIKEELKGKKVEIERRDAAERRWQYIQNHPISKINIEFYLRSTVGREWLTSMFKDIYITFSRNGRGLDLSEVLEKSQAPNTKEWENKVSAPICSFWQLYEHEPGYWCKKIKKTAQSPNLVAGFDAIIPWSFVGMAAINSLKDLSGFNSIGVSVTPKLFQAGLEELILTIEGKGYSFKMYFSEQGLDLFHEAAGTLFTLSKGKKDDIMTCGMHYDGIQLLEKFHDQMMPDYERPNKDKGIFGGMSGPESSISFYPGMPRGFSKNPESEEYSFNLTVPSEVDYKGMEKSLKEVIYTGKASIDDYVKLAWLYSLQGRFQEVIGLLTKPDLKFVPNSSFHGILGSAYAYLGRYQEAIDELRKSALLDPENANTQKILGRCYHELEENEAALEFFKKAADLEPTNSGYQHNLGRAFAILGEIAKAIKHIRIATELVPDDSDYLIGLGALLFSEGEIVEAIVLLEKGILLDPTSAIAHRYLGLALKKSGDIEKALMSFEKSINLEETVECYTDWAKTLCDNHRWGEAEPIIQKGLTIDPKHLWLLIYLGVVLANQGYFEKSLETLTTAKAIDPVDKTVTELIEKVKARINTKTEPKKARKRK
jgi:tetratricopeptide (TPR) repeat protein/nucleoside phosphorylase